MICHQGHCRAGLSPGPTDQQTRASKRPIEQTPAHDFASLTEARTYVDSIRQNTSALAAHELNEALECLDGAYNEFPELLLDCPRGDLFERLRSRARDIPNDLAVSILLRWVALDPSCSFSVASLLEKITRFDDQLSQWSISRLLARSREIPWSAIEPIVTVLRRQDRAETILEIISKILDSLKFPEAEDASDFRAMLMSLLSDAPQAAGDSIALAKAVLSAWQRLNRLPRHRTMQGSNAALLAMAERLRAAPPPQRSDPPDVAWPSSWMSFEEFLLQWPCEVELPLDLDDTAFIEEAYRAILLRESDPGEKDQYLKLLQNASISKEWIIEDLLASEEFHSLERRLRVIWGRHVITEPGGSGEEMATVLWPWRSRADGS